MTLRERGWHSELGVERQRKEARRDVPPHEELVSPDLSSPVCPDVRRLGPHAEERTAEIHDLEGEEETNPGESGESRGTSSEDEIGAVTSAVVRVD